MRRGSENVLHRDADVAAPDLAVAHQQHGDELRGVDPDREANPLRPREGRGVDADDASASVDERAAGVARVQRRVRLQHVIDEAARRRAQRAAQGADDAGRDGRLQPVRVSERDRERTDAHVARVAERRRNEVARGDADDGEVGVGIVADDGTRKRAAVEQRDVERARVVDDVAVRDEEAVGREHEPRAAAAPAARGDLDVDDGRTSGFDRGRDGMRVCVERVEFVALVGNIVDHGGAQPVTRRGDGEMQACPRRGARDAGGEWAWPAPWWRNW